MSKLSLLTLILLFAVVLLIIIPIESLQAKEPRADLKSYIQSAIAQYDVATGRQARGRYLSVKDLIAAWSSTNRIQLRDGQRLSQIWDEQKQLTKNFGSFDEAGAIVLADMYTEITGSESHLKISTDSLIYNLGCYAYYDPFCTLWDFNQTIAQYL